MGENRWRGYDPWPVPGAQEECWYLARTSRRGRRPRRAAPRQRATPTSTTRPTPCRRAAVRRCSPPRSRAARSIRGRTRTARMSFATLARRSSSPTPRSARSAHPLRLLVRARHRFCRPPRRCLSRWPRHRRRRRHHPRQRPRQLPRARRRRGRPAHPDRTRAPYRVQHRPLGDRDHLPPRPPPARRDHQQQPPALDSQPTPAAMASTRPSWQSPDSASSTIRSGRVGSTSRSASRRSSWRSDGCERSWRSRRS